MSPAADTSPAAIRPSARLGTSRLTAIPYPDCDPPTFHATLIRAHDASLDCPELHGLLTPDEVLAGYRDSAPDPATWWLALADDRPAGVLLLNGDELTFLGVVPEVRRRGVGRSLLDLALRQSPALSLIVDARNTPAFQLYRSAGLEVVGAREVFLLFPPPAAGTTDPKVRRS
jgi:ribosomal protein S18 acetylase RimI-like enzyme